MWPRTNLNAKVNQNYLVTLNRKSQGQGHRERSQLRRSHQGLFQCKVSSLYWLMWPRTNLNAEVNQNCKVTLKRKSQGQGCRERSQLRRSHQGLFPCKVSSLYWLIWPRTNLNAEVNQNVDGQTDGRTDRQTDRQTDRHHQSISRNCFCNPAKNVILNFIIPNVPFLQQISPPWDIAVWHCRVTFKIVTLPIDQSDCWKLTWGIIM